MGDGCERVQDPDHSALVYGYNFNAPTPYLMFKNNWGTDFGMMGYYNVAIGELTDSNYGLCLIANTPYNTMPIIK